MLQLVVWCVQPHDKPHDQGGDVRCAYDRQQQGQGLHIQPSTISSMQSAQMTRTSRVARMIVPQSGQW